MIVRWLAVLLSIGAHGIPPHQTAVQKQVADKHHVNAKAASDAAKPRLISLLDSAAFRSEIQPLGNLTKASAAELVEMLYEEVSLAGMSHSLGDDRLAGITQLGYLATVWAAVCEGVIQYNPGWAGMDNNEVRGMGFPAMPLPPPKPQCYDRQVYLGHNIWKQSGGQLWAGPIGLFVDFTHVENGTFIAPVDTGFFYGQCGFHSNKKNNSSKDKSSDDDNIDNDDDDGPWTRFGVTAEKRAMYGSLSPPTTTNATTKGLNCGAWDGKTYGTLHHFYHSIMSHVAVYNLKMSQLFLRWYGKGYPIPPELEMRTYMEGELAVTFLVPDTLLFVAAKYDDLFGNDRGKAAQTWAYSKYRPMAWSNDNTGGTIVDAHVNRIDGVYNITSADGTNFLNFWAHKPAWATFRDQSSIHLQLHILGYHNRKECTTVKSCSNCRFLGVNKANQCLYWHPR